MKIAPKKTVAHLSVWQTVTEEGSHCSYYLIPTPVAGKKVYSLLVLQEEKTAFFSTLGAHKCAMERFVRRLALEGVTVDQVGDVIEDALGQVPLPF